MQSELIHGLSAAALRAAAKAARKWKTSEHGPCELSYFHNGHRPSEFVDDQDISDPSWAEHG